MDSPEVSVDELLAHAHWVRGLAARLVRDPASADDVAQEVWASALRRPPGRTDNVRGWLAAAVRNAARSLARGEERRKAHETDSAAESEQLEPGELVARAELHRELVEHVLSLGEPHRALVLARWFEGLSVAEAGRRLGMSSRVAQLRLDTAHELLRQRMDRSHGGRKAWSLMLLPHAHSKAILAGSTGAFATGGIVLGKKLFAAGVIVLASASFLFWSKEGSIERDGAISTPDVALELPQDVEAVTAPASEERRTALDTDHPASVPPVAPTITPRWFVRGKLSGEPAGTAERTIVTARFVGRWAINDHVDAAPSKDGSFEIELTKILERWLRSGGPNDLLVTAVHPACLHTESRAAFGSAELDPSDATGATHVFHCDVKLEQAAVVTGKVIVPIGWQPRAEARGLKPPAIAVALLERGIPGQRDARSSLESAACDAQGGFTLHANHSGAFDVIASVAGLHPESRQADLILGSSIEIDPITLSLGSSITGTVLRNGRPAGAGIEISAQLERSSDSIMVNCSSSGWGNLQQSGEQLALSNLRALTDTDGRYRFDGLAPAQYELYVASLPDSRAQLGGIRRVERTVRAPQDDVELHQLPPLIHFSCTIDGRTPTKPELDEGRLSIVAPGSGREANEFELWRFNEAMAVHPDEAYELRGAPGHFEPVTVFIPALAMSEERDVHFDLKTRAAESSLVVRLLAKHGDVIERAQFALVDRAATAAASLTWKELERGKDGTFVMRDLPPGRRWVRVIPHPLGGNVGTPYLGTEFEVELLIGKPIERTVQLELGSRIRLCAKDERGGFLGPAVQLRDARGETIATDFNYVGADGQFGAGWCLSARGINDHSPLPAGHYELTLSLEGFETAVAPLDLVKGETTTLEIPMRHR